MSPDQTPSYPQTVQAVKDLRVKIDSCVQDTQTLLDGLQISGSFSRALSLVKTKLEEAEMWGDKRLKEINPDSYPKELADKANAVPVVPAQPESLVSPQQTIVPAQPAIPNADTATPQGPPTVDPNLPQ